MRKSQSAVEFVVLATFMIFVIMGFFAVISSKTLEAEEESKRKIAEDIASIAYNEIVTAKSVNDGYIRTFVMPYTINGNDYTIEIIGDRELIVKYQDYEYIKFLPVNFTGDINKGFNEIRKKNDVIYMDTIFFDFFLTDDGPKSVTVGNSATISIATALTLGEAEAVSFSVSGLPTDATASFSQNSCTPACTTTLTIATSASTPVGMYTITVTGTGGGTTRTTSFILNVELVPLAFNFSLSNGGSKSVTQGQSVNNTITATLVLGTAQSVSFSASGLPTGATATFAPISCTPTCSTTLTISTLSTTPTGTYTITVTGTATGVSPKTTTFTLTVNPITPGAQLITYPAPPGIISPTDYSVKVNGQQLFVYPVRVAGDKSNDPPPEIASLVYFDFSGSVTVEVTSSRAVSSVDIRPKSYGITPSINGNKITFILSQPRKVSLELNGNLHFPLFVIGNPIEVSPPNPGDPNVLYFGPGIHRPGRIRPTSGQTVYIAGGAVVRGFIDGVDVQNVKVLGRGIIDGSEQTGGPLNRFLNSKDITIDGIILIGGGETGWINPIYDSERVTISNLKIFGSTFGGDGLDIVDSQYVTVDDCFIRTWDDNIAIKGFGGFGGPYSSTYDRSSIFQPKSITVSRCVGWSDRANNFAVGHVEFRNTNLASDFLFKDSDVIHNTAYNAALTVWNSDGAMVKDVRYENIRVEDARNLFRILVDHTMWSEDPERGNIKNLYFKDISVTGGIAPASLIKGYDSTHKVENITFENLRIHGNLILNAAAGNFTIGPYAYNVNFIAGPTTASAITVDASSPRGPMKTYIGFTPSHGYPYYHKRLTSSEQTRLRDANTKFIRIVPDQCLSSNTVEYLSTAEGVYNWAVLDGNVENAMNAMGSGGEIMVDIFVPPWLSDPAWRSSATTCSQLIEEHAPPTDYNKWQAYVRDIVNHLNNVKGYNIKYFQVLNEPNYGDSDVPSLAPNIYGKIYQYAAQGIKVADPSVKVVGGVMSSIDNPVWTQSFLNFISANSAPLDILDWHQYTKYPAGIMNEVTIARNLLNGAGYISAEVMVSEWNWECFGSCDRTLTANVNAATGYIAPMIYYLLESGVNEAMWYRVVGYWSGNPPATPDIFQLGGTPVWPQYNVFKMLGMMATERIDATGLAMNPNGIGRGALASRDAAKVTVLAWNYQNTGATPASFTLNINNLPAAFSSRNIRVERYLVDSTHSNVMFNSAKAELEKVENNIISPTGTVTLPLTLSPNAVTLVVLTPV